MKAEIMSPEHKQILKNTWAMVAPISDTAAGLFYDRLFTLDPSLKPLFAKADMQEQRRKLMQAIAAVINGVDHLDASREHRRQPRRQQGRIAHPTGAGTRRAGSGSGDAAVTRAAERGA